MTINTPNTGVDIIFCSTSNDPKAPCTSGSNLQATARSRHTGGVNVAMCDGSIRFMSNSIGSTVWASLGSMNGGETFTLP